MKTTPRVPADPVTYGLRDHPLAQQMFGVKNQHRRVVASGRQGMGIGRRIASVYTWAATLPGGGRCLAMTVNGNHNVGIAVEPQGFIPDCRTCHMPGRPYDTALEAAEALHAHTERPL